MLKNIQDDNIITLELSSSGQVIVKSQVVDYQHRGVGLEDYSVLDFFVETYETEITKTDRMEELFDDDAKRGPGRPRNPRVRYLTSHPKSGTVHRVIRSPGHRNLPNFLGRWFPRNDDDAIYNFYCASMLLLLKPWRDLTTDLKLSNESWAAAFEAFSTSATPRARRALSGIQYFHECESAAQKDTTDARPYQVPIDSQILDDESGMDHVPHSQEFSEEGLALLKAETVSLREELHGRMAIELARHLGIFSNEQQNWTVTQHGLPSNATEEDLSRISMWHNLLQSAVDQRASVTNTALPEDTHTATIECSTLPSNPLLDTPAAILIQSTASEQALPAVEPGCLKPDQLRAYRIVTWHLGETLRGNNIPPLRMILYGEGGTGKSRVIQTITEAFAARGVSHMLMKAAYTGVAASLVDGKTTHIIGSLSLGSKDNISDATKKKLQDFWRNIRYLIIDEYSMLSKSFLATLSRNISIGMEGSEGFQRGVSFGGLNVILCGDLHQFPPVACGKREPLYYPIKMDEPIMLQVGRRIYEEFSTVVILQEQMRVTDHVWRDFLDHLRYGRVEPRHLKMLRTLLLRRQAPNTPLEHSPNAPSLPNPHTDPTEAISPFADFSVQPWADASLITPRHSVRTRWNQAATQKCCTDSKTRLFVCKALDTIKGSPLTLEEQYALASLPKMKGRRRRDKGLPELIHIAIGMNVMVTNNLQTDLDITNGARGVIMDVILNPNEPPLDDGSVVTLQYLPECILVKLSRTRAAALPDLEEGVIPISRISTKTQIRVRGKTRTVTRAQFPITGAYAFTDYRAQGQTIPYVIVDIATPPTSGLSLFNLYVALSRSSGRNTIRLLRDFDDETFLQAHVPELLEEDERLEEFDTSTKGWWAKMLTQT